jgi:transposase-like protein
VGPGSALIHTVAAIIAVAVDTEGRREIVGLHISPSEAETFWSAFLKGLVRRGLKGVRLVVSDAHEGLKHAIAKVLGATWQRCRVHRMRNALARLPKGQHSMAAAALRQAFSQPDGDTARQAWRHLADHSAPAGPGSPRSWTRASMTCWPTWRSRPSTAPSCTARTRSSG